MKQTIINKKKEEQTLRLSLNEMKEFSKYSKVVIDPSKPLKQYEQKIIEMEQKKQKYRIWIDYYNNSSIEQKNEVIDMIDRLNVNHKVGWIRIRMNQDNPINQQMIRMMNERYQNINELIIYDENESIDDSVYQEWIAMIEEKTLLRFGIVFNDSLESSDEAFNWMKRINQKIKEKKDMEQLRYRGPLKKWLGLINRRIDKEADTVDGIQRLIKRVEQM